MFRVAAFAAVVGAGVVAYSAGVQASSEVSAWETTGRCSMASPWRSFVPTDTYYFMGAATADSVQASAAGVEYSMAPGNELPVRGQVVRVSDGFHRDPGTAEMLAAAGSYGTGEVVVVWWDYDTMCHTRFWSRSVVHAQPGMENVFAGRLRDPADWAGGVPTVDVYRPFHTPFPGSEHRMDERRRELGMAPRGETLLTPRQLFDYLSRLPSRDPQSTHGPTREEMDAVLEWADAHPELADALPVRSVVRNMRSRR